MSELHGTQRPGRSELVLIAAVARNGVIGKDNTLPWRLKADLQHFKTATMGQPILMGRKTWESLGRVLPGRRHLVITRDNAYAAPGIETYPSIEAALTAVADLPQVFVIGGAQIYQQTIAWADRLLITEVGAEVEGDAVFPYIDPAVFREHSRAAFKADEVNEFDYSFVEYQRCK
jgi:dihydrofolate reductase